MVGENPLTWEEEPPENFLNKHLLYRGVFKYMWKTWENLNKIYPNFFMTKSAVKGLSVDWSKYATPQTTLNCLNSNLTECGIAEINVGEFRHEIDINNFPLTIHHKPNKVAKKNLPINRAHTLIKGFNQKNTTKIRRKISKIVKWSPNMRPIIEG